MTATLMPKTGLTAALGRQGIRRRFSDARHYVFCFCWIRTPGTRKCLYDSCHFLLGYGEALRQGDKVLAEEAQGTLEKCMKFAGGSMRGALQKRP